MSEIKGQISIWNMGNEVVETDVKTREGLIFHYCRECGDLLAVYSKHLGRFIYSRKMCVSCNRRTEWSDEDGKESET